MALLLSNINRMMYDMLNVFVFIIIFVLGFSASLYMASYGENEEISNYGSATQAFRTTMYGFIDGMDWAEFNNINGVYKAFFIQMWIFLFVIFAVLILLNLIIAIMSSTYENVNQSAKLNVNFNQWKVCYSRSKQLPILPPPFDFIIFVFVTIIQCVLYLIECKDKNKFTANMHKLIYYNKINEVPERKEDDKDKDKEWICRYCANKNFVEVTGIEHLDDGKNISKDFAFEEKERDKLKLITLDLCFNCHRSKNMASTHNIIESLLSFYLLIIFIAPIRVMTFMVYLALFVLVILLLIIKGILYIPMWCCTRVWCDVRKACCSYLKKAYSPLNRWHTYCFSFVDYPLERCQSFMDASSTRSRIKYDFIIKVRRDGQEYQSKVLHGTDMALPDV
eukprot:330125_1